IGWLTFRWLVVFHGPSPAYLATRAQTVIAAPSIAGRLTAGKSRDRSDAAQMPTATSQTWNRAWPASQSDDAPHSGARSEGLAAPNRNAPPTSRKIRPISRMKCWLNGPVVVTPGTAKYQPSGATSI